MKKAKHLLALLLLAAMTVALAACGGDVPPNEVFSADDLPGKTIGVQENTTGDIFASDYEKEGSTVERYSKGNDAIQALIQGKIDCVIIDEEPAKAFVAENEGKLTILETPFEIEDYAIAIKKGNTELLNAVNGALDQLEQDGTLQSIIDNYIGVNAGETPYESPADVSRENGTLVMATNAYFPPYEYYENGEVVGLDVDVAQAICDILGYELEVEDMEFGSIIAALDSGLADIGVAGMTVTEDRLENVDFSDFYATGVQVIIVRADAEE